MSNYVVESKKEAIKILRSVSEEVVTPEGNFKYAVAEGIVAIEKQIPEKVINNGHDVYFCSKCKGSVWQIRHESNYCFRCGQKLGWKE